MRPEEPVIKAFFMMFGGVLGEAVRRLGGESVRRLVGESVSL